MQRRKILAGNWKMNKSLDEVYSFASEWVELSKELDHKIEIIFAPAFPFLFPLKSFLGESSIKIAAQNCHQTESGAYTGEVSVAMLKSIGCEYVILGHSERRKYNAETNELIADKLFKVLESSLSPILCIGETLDERNSGQHFSVVNHQIHVALSKVELIVNLIIAYEPVWAIGTGETATPEQAEEMHLYIRHQLVEKFGNVGLEIPILYGGSCNPGNAKELFSCPNIDGGLIGGASLKPEDFQKIAKSF